MRFQKPNILIFILIIGLAISGCARKEGPERIVATINDYKMTVDDFNYESKEILHMGRLLGDVPANKEDILDALITKELLLQEAQKENLDKEKDFTKSIELYWEQTLLKNLLTKKSREILKTVMAYENEIIDYYEKMPPAEKAPLSEIKDEIIMRIKMEKERELMDEWIEGLRSKARIRINKKVLDDLR